MIPLTIPFSSVFDWSSRHDQFLINFQPKLTTFTVSGPKFCLAGSKLVEPRQSGEQNLERMVSELAAWKRPFQHRIKKHLDLFAQTRRLLLILMTDAAGSRP